jgi:hypothetical protein
MMSLLRGWLVVAERGHDFLLRSALPKAGSTLHLDRQVWGYHAHDRLLSLETGEVVKIQVVRRGLRDILVLRGQDGTEAFWTPAGSGWLLV